MIRMPLNGYVKVAFDYVFVLVADKCSARYTAEDKVSCSIR